MLSGCVSTSNKLAGLCQIEQTKDQFNNSAQVEFTNCWTATSESVWDIPSYKFGFTWLESAPEKIQMNLTYDSTVSGDAYTNFESVSINFAGAKYRYDNLSNTILSDSGYNNVTQTIYTSSRSALTVPMHVFESMVKSKDARIRIVTSDGYEDYLFHIDENGMTKYTKYYMRDYLAAIDIYR